MDFLIIGNGMWTPGIKCFNKSRLSIIVNGLLLTQEDMVSA